MGVNLYTQQSTNVYKTWGLMLLMTALALVIGWFFSEYYQDTTILGLVFIAALILNFIGYWYSDAIALSSTGSILADETTYRELHRTVENLSITAGLPKPRVDIIPDQAPNAFATGRDKEHAAIAVTTGLLAIMEPAELEGVIAHELAHIGNRDILLATSAVVIAGFIALLSDFFLHFGGRRSGNKEGGGLFAIIAIVLLILAPIMATLIRLALSRRREYQADTTAVLLTRYPDGLATALQKISLYTRPMNRASDATAHLFISSPFGNHQKGIHKLFLTHPPVEKRIEAILGVQIEENNA